MGPSRGSAAAERRVAIVAALRDLPADLVARLVACLDVDPRVAGVEVTKARAPVPARAPDVLDAPIYAAADAMDVRAADFRAALGPVLAAIVEVGLDAASAGADRRQTGIATAMRPLFTGRSVKRHGPFR